MKLHLSRDFKLKLLWIVLSSEFMHTHINTSVHILNLKGVVHPKMKIMGEL